MAHRLLPIPDQVTRDVSEQPYRHIVLSPISGFGEGAVWALVQLRTLNRGRTR